MEEETPLLPPINGGGNGNGKGHSHPFAIFQASPLTGPAPLTVSLNASRSRPGPGNGVLLDYTWSFGDNSPTASDVSVEHTYSVPGSYIVTLTVEDAFLPNSTSKTITVTRPLPVAAFSANPVSDFAPLVVRFDASASGIAVPNAFLKSYTWDFGDGNTGSGNVVFHRYDQPGICSVSLTVTDDVNATGTVRKDNLISVSQRRDPVATITATPTTGIVPLAVTFTVDAVSPDDPISSYVLDFGDGNSVINVLSTTHRYLQPGLYAARLTVTGEHNTRAFADVAIEAKVNQPPVASFVSSPSGPLSIRFDASQSSDPDDAIVNYAWDFGDSSSTSGADSIVLHTYKAAGSYTVQLTVTDAGGNKSNAPFTKQVTVVPPGPPPVAKFSATPTSGTPALSVVFNGSFSDGIIADQDYTWTFGDNTQGSGSNPPPKIYANEGIYLAQLKVKDIANATSSSCMTISVTGGPIPVTQFTANPVSGPAPLNVSFDASAFVLPNETISQYAWDFGDGQQETGGSAMANHTYDHSGQYSVVLIATGSAGTKACASNIITVS